LLQVNVAYGFGFRLFKIAAAAAQPTIYP
jgi:hypothetical protein